MKEKYNVDKLLHIGLSSIFIVVFCPVLFLIFMFGNTLDYNPVNKLLTTYGNKRLLIIGLIVMFAFFCILMLFQKVEKKKRVEHIVTCSLAVAFVLLYFVNEEICKCIWFPQGWDVSCVVGTAYRLHAGVPIGNEVYYSIYENNVPMAFVLYHIYKFAANSPLYPYVADFLWIQMICAMLSAAGWATCMAIKKITKNVGAVVVGFILYTGCIGISPWKTVPYTDMYAIFFLCLFCRYNRVINKTDSIDYSYCLYCFGDNSRYPQLEV